MSTESELIIDCTDEMLESYRRYQTSGDPNDLPGNWKNDPVFLESLQQAEESGFTLIAGNLDDGEDKNQEQIDAEKPILLDWYAKAESDGPEKVEFDKPEEDDPELQQYLQVLNNVQVQAKRPAIEILVPLWPHTNDTDDKKNDLVRSVTVVFLIIWVIAALWHFVQLFNSGTYYFLKLLVFALIPLFAFSQGTTHILLNPKGIFFQSRLAGSNRTRRHIDWEDLADVYLEQSPHLTILDWKLKFKQKNGITHTVKLSKIANREQWHHLTEGLNRWCPIHCRGVNRDIFDSLAVSRQDPTYTTLWLQALSSPPKRERLQPLIEGAVLQNSKYEVSKILGSGGQGTAYLAKRNESKNGTEDATKNQAENETDNETDNETENKSENKSESVVVLKEYILPVFVDAKVRREAIETFNHETDVLKRVRSPLIVSLDEAFVEDNRAYLVLEYVDGPSLKTYIATNGILDEKDAVKHALTMCDMLTHLHSLTPAVIHRDFTPDNLILTSSGQLKLIDFMVAQDSTDNVAGVAMGKQAFMPPEQLRGKATICCDLYALGGTIFYMLTGQYPEAISQSRPSMFNSKVSVELDEIVSKCTALDIADRYQTAREIKADLEKCAAEAASL